MPAPPTAPLRVARVDRYVQVWFLAEMNAPSLQVGLAAALLGASGTILLGIAVAPLALAAASPALSAMGVPTLVALGLGATALLAPADHPKAETLATLLAALVLSVGALTLGALAWSGSEFGLWRGLLGLFPKSDNLLLWPGRVTLPAAIGLLCAGAAMIAMRLRRTTGSALPIQLLIAVVALTGAFGILTCLTGIGSLYRLNPQVAMMRWPAGVGLLALALALAFAARRVEAVREYYAQREDRQVFALSLVVILAVLLSAWATGAGMMIRDWVASSENALLASARFEARLLASSIGHQNTEALELSRASGIPAAFASRNEGTRLLLAREAMARAMQYSAHAAIVGIRVQKAPAETLLEYGRTAKQLGPALALAEPDGALLMSDHGLLLRSRFALPTIDGTALQLVVDARLHDQPDAEGTPVLGRAFAQMGLCRIDAAQPQCTAPADLAPMTTLLMQDSFKQGLLSVEPRVVMHSDSKTGNELLAFAPLDSSGVLLLLRVRVSDLLLPLRGQIAWGLSVLVLLGLIGSMLIQRRAQLAVRRLVRTRAELAAVLDHAPDAICVTDHAGKVITANRAAAGHFGAAADALCGRPIDTLLPGLAGTGETKAARSVLAKRTDGSQFPAEATVTRFALDGSARMLFIVRDVSVQFATLKENERWVQVFEHAGWGVALTNADGTAIERANPAFARMHGCTVADLIGAPLQNYIAPSFHSLIPEVIDRINAKGSDSFESAHQRADGSIFPVLVNSSLVRDAAGDILYRAVSIQDISEIKAAEDALRHSEALLSAVLEALPVGVWVTDAQGAIIRGNSAGKTIWGGARQVAIAHYGEFRGWWQGSGKRIAADEWALARAIAKGETALDEVVNIEAFDGNFKTISNSAVPLRGPDGLITGAVVVDEDISARISTAEELRLSKELFQTIVSSASVGMALCAPDGQPLLVNAALCQLLGYREQEILDRSLLEITCHDDLPAARERMRRALDGDCAAYQIEKRYVHCDGHLVWVLQAVALVRDASGRPRYFIAQLIDISLRKTMEDQLRASQHRLAQAQNMARLGDWEWDLATGAMRWSDTALDILDHPGNGPSLCEIAQLPIVNADDGARLLAGINDTLATGTPLAVDFSVSARDRGQRAVHLRGELLRGNQDTSERIRGTLQDVTERKAIEQALRQSREELRALSGHLEIAREEERKRIALEVHDELGQLLTALRMQVTLLRLGSANRKDAARRLEEMRHLVDRTLGVTRHLVANLRPSALNFGLMPALEWLVEDFREHSGLACEADFGTDDLSLDDATTTTLFRLAQKALTNVAKHAGATRVELAVTVDGGVLTLTISDNGRGFQLDQALRGSHFGLVGMRERVRLLGGELHIDTAPAQGTIIRITCPLPQPCPSAS